MTTRLPNVILRLAAWLALSWFGYWGALLLDDLLLRLTLDPLLGSPIADWRLSAFRAFVATEPAPAGMLRLVLPLLLQGALLLFVARRGNRPAATAMTALHFAGLWTVLLLSGQAALLVALGRGRFASLLGTALGSGPSPLAVRYAVFGVLFVALIAAGVTCAARLADAFAFTLRPAAAPRWLFLLALGGSVLFVLAGSFGFRFRFLGTRGTFLFFVPFAFCLLLGILGLRKQAVGRAKPFAPDLPQARLSLRAAATIPLVALLLGWVMGNANQAGTALAEKRLATVSTPHYDIRYDPGNFSADRIASLGSERERTLLHLMERLRFAEDPATSSLPYDDVRIQLILFPDFASKRAATSSDLPYNVTGTTVRALLYGYLDHVDTAADAAAVLHAMWGPSGSPAMESWVARLLAGQYRGRNVEECASQIETEVGHYALEQLLAADTEHFISPLATEPLGAAWIALVHQRYGLQAVRRLYSRSTPMDLKTVATTLGVSPKQLEDEWTDWTAQLRTKHPYAIPAARPLPAEFFRGVTFSHEGFGGRRGGYVDPAAFVQLRRIRDIGGNAISVVPYGLMRNPGEPLISTAFTDETDEELTQALHMAHGLGLRVMLKPQIWVSFGQFTGNLRFDDPEKRAAWMRSYREFILHYARLAENEGFDLLCIGNELEGMTTLETEWRQLIAEIRRVYHGPITYAANWGTEFESLRFWDAVDYMGLNNYYPLTKPLQNRAVAAEADPTSGARALAARLDAFYARWRKPILFTEAGYPSLRGGTAEPWVEDPARGAAPAEQAAGYEAVFEAFHQRAWLRGMFWWKWPSHGRGGGPQDTSFVLTGKPAEEVLRAWYTRMANGSGAGANSGP